MDRPRVAQVDLLDIGQHFLDCTVLKLTVTKQVREVATPLILSLCWSGAHRDGSIQIAIIASLLLFLDDIRNIHMFLRNIESKPGHSSGLILVNVPVGVADLQLDALLLHLLQINLFHFLVCTQTVVVDAHKVWTFFKWRSVSKRD